MLGLERHFPRLPQFDDLPKREDLSCIKKHQGQQEPEGTATELVPIQFEFIFILFDSN